MTTATSRTNAEGGNAIIIGLAEQCLRVIFYFEIRRNICHISEPPKIVNVFLFMYR